MLKLHTFINSPVSSNTYIIEDIDRRECIIIDPGTKGSTKIIEFLQSNSLSPKFIMLTHGDFDHTWGVNSLRDYFPDIKLIASRETARLIAIPQNYFSALYYNNLEYYCIDKIDVIIDDNDNHIFWNDYEIKFIQVPGHTICSNIILLDNWLFSGDTILKNTKPFIQKKHGGNKTDFKESVKFIIKSFPDNQIIQPGHGFSFLLGEVKEYYKNYLNDVL